MKKQLNLGQLLVGGSGLLLFVFSLFPFEGTKSIDTGLGGHVGGESRNGWSSDLPFFPGTLFIALFGLALAAWALMGYLNKPLPAEGPAGRLIGLLPFALVFYNTFFMIAVLLSNHDQLKLKVGGILMLLVAIVGAVGIVLDLLGKGMIEVGGNAPQQVGGYGQYPPQGYPQQGGYPQQPGQPQYPPPGQPQGYPGQQPPTSFPQQPPQPGQYPPPGQPGQPQYPPPGQPGQPPQQPPYGGSGNY